MNAVIIYEYSNLGLKACALLERVTQHADGFPWEIHPWRMDMILSSAYSDLSHEEAARAHVIVFALGTTTGLSTELSQWLERWAQGRSVTDAALVIFDAGGEDGNLLATPLAQGLDKFANRHRLCLLAGDISPADDNDIYFGARISQHFSAARNSRDNKPSTRKRPTTPHG